MKEKQEKNPKNIIASQGNQKTWIDPDISDYDVLLTKENSQKKGTCEED